MVRLESTGYFLFFIPVKNVSSKCCGCTIKTGILTITMLNIFYFLMLLFTVGLQLANIWCGIELIGFSLLVRSLITQKSAFAKLGNIILTINFYFKLILFILILSREEFRVQIKSSYQDMLYFAVFLQIIYFLMIVYFMWIIFSFAALAKHDEFDIIEGIFISTTQKDVREVVMTAPSGGNSSLILV
jgi:hypothetical protein